MTKKLKTTRETIKTLRVQTSVQTGQAGALRVADNWGASGGHSQQ
jgi:hypothetical protein